MAFYTSQSKSSGFLAWFFSVIFAGIIVALTSVISSAASAGDYKLGPQDRLAVRVYDLRKNAGEAYPWAALNGEFSVGADGAISMPILGQIAAQGRTASELSLSISQALKQKADLAELPSAAVEVIKYRPFYIIGSVQDPGRYEYSPGLTVLQAVSLAKGFERSSDAYGIEKDIRAGNGEVKALNAELVSLSIKAARLKAELNDLPKFVVPPQIAKLTDSDQFDQSAKIESNLLETRRESIKSELDTLSRSKGFFQQELSSLEAKGKTLDKQIEISRRDVAQVSELISRGLAVSPRQMTAEQSQASYENSRLDVQIATLRARQSLSNVERDIIELNSRYKKEILDSIADLTSKIAQIKQKIYTSDIQTQSAKKKLIEIGVPDPDNDISYVIVRSKGSSSEALDSTETDALEPGDVLRVFVRNLRSQNVTIRVEPDTANGVGSNR